MYKLKNMIDRCKQLQSDRVLFPVNSDQYSEITLEINDIIYDISEEVIKNIDELKDAIKHHKSVEIEDIDEDDENYSDNLDSSIYRLEQENIINEFIDNVNRAIGYYGPYLTKNEYDYLKSYLLKYEEEH